VLLRLPDGSKKQHRGVWVITRAAVLFVDKAEGADGKLQDQYKKKDKTDACASN
jgi:hypothetical protein